VVKHGGWMLFKRNPALEGAISLHDVLKAIYPEYHWDPSKFVNADLTRRGHWQDASNLNKALDDAERLLGIRQVRNCFYFYFLFFVIFFKKAKQ